MNPLFLSLILFVCLSVPGNCEDNSQAEENQDGETILVTDQTKDQSEKDESPNSSESERDRDMLGLLAGTIQGEVLSDEARNAAIAENNNI